MLEDWDEVGFVFEMGALGEVFFVVVVGSGFGFKKEDRGVRGGHYFIVYPSEKKSCYVCRHREVGTRRV